MFEDDELSAFNNTTLKHTCSFCNKEIKLCPCSDINNKLKFCDLICAKLYYDNVEHFTIDIKRYNNYYNECQLSKKARDVFERCRWLVFEQLPIYQPSQSDPAFNNPKLMRKVYNKTLSPVLFKSIGAYE